MFVNFRPRKNTDRPHPRRLENCGRISAVIRMRVATSFSLYSVELMSSRDTVLVIDDNIDFCQLIVLIGQCYGVRVLEAVNCREGLSVLSHELPRIKLILL